MSQKRKATLAPPAPVKEEGIPTDPGGSGSSSSGGLAQQHVKRARGAEAAASARRATSQTGLVKRELDVKQEESGVKDIGLQNKGVALQSTTMVDILTGRMLGI